MGPPLLCIFFILITGEMESDKWNVICCLENISPCAYAFKKYSQVLSKVCGQYVSMESM